MYALCVSKCSQILTNVSNGVNNVFFFFFNKADNQSHSAQNKRLLVIAWFQSIAHINQLFSSVCGDEHQHMNKAAHVTARNRKGPLNSLKEKPLTGGLVFTHLYPRTHHLPPAPWSALYSNDSTLGSVKETCQLIFRTCRSPWLNAVDSALHGYRAGDTWEQHQHKYKQRYGQKWDTLP